jgi:hypothetical protein
VVIVTTSYTFTIKQKRLCEVLGVCTFTAVVTDETGIIIKFIAEIPSHKPTALEECDNMDIFVKHSALTVSAKFFILSVPQ